MPHKHQKTLGIAPTLPSIQLYAFSSAKITRVQPNDVGETHSVCHNLPTQAHVTGMHLWCCMLCQSLARFVVLVCAVLYQCGVE